MKRKPKKQVDEVSWYDLQQACDRVWDVIGDDILSAPSFGSADEEGIASAATVRCCVADSFEMHAKPAEVDAWRALSYEEAQLILECAFPDGTDYGY